MRLAGIPEPWVNYWLRDSFWGGIDYLSHYGLRCLPAAAVSKIGERLGLLAGGHRFPELDGRVKRNLEVIFPGIDAAEKDRLSRNMWGNIGRALAELSVHDRIPAGNRKNIDEEFVSGKLGEGPVIFLFVHLGNWELLIADLLRHVPRLHGVYERLPNRYQMRIANNARRRLGIDLLSPDYSGTRAMYSVLRGKGALMMAMDEFKNDTVYAPLFGRAPQKTNNINYAVTLAKKFDAIIAPVYNIREEGIRFSIHWQPVITPEYLKDNTAAVATDLHARMEQWVKQHIDQWYMLHRLQL